MKQNWNYCSCWVLVWGRVKESLNSFIWCPTGNFCVELNTFDRFCWTERILKNFFVFSTHFKMFLTLILSQTTKTFWLFPQKPFTMKWNPLKHDFALHYSWKNNSSKKLQTIQHKPLETTKKHNTRLRGPSLKPHKPRSN